MRVDLHFQDERLEIEVADDRLLGAWSGPEPLAETRLRAQIAQDLESPQDYPPLRQAVVPGDRVVLAVDPEIPQLNRLLAIVSEILEGSGVERDAIQVVALGPIRGLESSASIREPVTWINHNPDDREQLAYLASTEAGRRVYLNRFLTDSDFVLPVGLLTYDPILGYQGPWSTLFPGLSDLDTQQALRGQASDHTPHADHTRPAFDESAEVTWLLGSQFHIGILPGATGIAGVFAGLESTVRTQGMRALDRAWTFQVPERAELVIAGIGRPGVPTRLEDLARGLATSAGLVRRGGRIAILSRTEGPIGPALQRLLGAEDPRRWAEHLRGAEAEPDYPAARQIARALDWADVYLLSSLPVEDVEELAMIPLARPEEAARLAALSNSCLILSHADLTRGVVEEKIDTIYHEP
ncbi:hypothetical protein BH23PLA1_BH23PLA1_33380 [soil metagenome]